MTANTMPSRRQLLAMLAASMTLPRAASAQSSVLPVNTPGLDHLDVIVPDVEKSARFYMGLFRTRLHAQPFQGGQRYFVLLGPLPENRAVGYLAIGASNGRGSYIGHFCTSVVEWRRDGAAIFEGMRERLHAEGFGELLPAGNGSVFKDPDGIEIQFLPSPDTLVAAAVPSGLVPPEQGLVAPLRVESVVLQVSEVKRALDYYRILYGKESRLDAEGATFAFRNGSQLQIQSASHVEGGKKARIARFGIRVAAFDRKSAIARIQALGGQVISSDRGSLLLTDPDGIALELMGGEA